MAALHISGRAQPTHAHTHTRRVKTRADVLGLVWRGTTTTESLFWHMRRSDCPHLNGEQNENLAAFSAQLPSSNLVKCVPRTNSPAAPIRLELRHGVLTPADVAARRSVLDCDTLQFLWAPSTLCTVFCSLTALPRCHHSGHRRWLQDNSGQQRWRQ